VVSTNGAGAAAAESVSEARNIAPADSREYPSGAKSSVKGICGPLRPHESSDDYPAVVAILDDRTRVIECANGIQWIVQRRSGRIWQGIYFCRTKAGLLLYARPITPELLALPDYFPERPHDQNGGSHHARTVARARTKESDDEECCC
jgi:hypothetical protein